MFSCLMCLHNGINICLLLGCAIFKSTSVEQHKQNQRITIKAKVHFNIEAFLRLGKYVIFQKEMLWKCFQVVGKDALATWTFPVKASFLPGESERAAFMRSSLEMSNSSSLLSFLHIYICRNKITYTERSLFLYGWCYTPVFYVN